MRRRLTIIIVLIISLLCLGCGNFEYGFDKFYLESIVDGGQNSTWYYFRKKISTDMIMSHISDKEPNGYDLKGQSHVMGFWGAIHILDFDDNNQDIDLYISASFCCYSKEGMGDTKLNIYFNYTVASTGERKEEVWEVDFGQEPYEDKR